ncbi:MCE family protein [Nocardia abscessus]|uniref:MCE family protein n=2 Tax=Nocardia abscessus TaxID=120957 RepID=UPI002456B109|nr:MCE family protein [Nocardia abscessus]
MSSTMKSLTALSRELARPAAGLASIALGIAVISLSLTMFNGGFADTVPVTVLSPRAGLVMYPDADVKMRGVTVGKVESIEERADGLASIRLAIDAGQLDLIPADVRVDIASTTVFGAKFVQLVPPERPARQAMRAGQVLESDHVTVEINTVFQQLTSVLGRIEPEKLNETLGAIAGATGGRGDKLGLMLGDLENFLAQLEPGLPALQADLAMAPQVLNTYADAAPALLDTARNTAAISRTIVDEQQNLDAMLIGLIGLSDIGTQVLGDNRAALDSALAALVPTTTLTNEYHEALTCALDGFGWLSQSKPVDVPGLGLSANFLFGTEPYRYPRHLPKVAATGGPQCSVIPVPYEGRPPFVVADVGANPFEKGNQTVELNVGNLPQALFGPFAGAPRQGAPR